MHYVTIEDQRSQEEIGFLTKLTKRVTESRIEMWMATEWNKPEESLDKIDATFESKVSYVESGYEYAYSWYRNSSKLEKGQIERFYWNSEVIQSEGEQSINFIGTERNGFTLKSDFPPKYSVVEVEFLLNNESAEEMAGITGVASVAIYHPDNYKN